MLEGLKQILNWGNCTLDELYSYITLLGNEALDNCHENIKGDITRLFKNIYSEAPLRMNDFSRSYCIISLANLSSAVTKNSKYRDNLSIATIKLLLKRHISLFAKVLEEDDFIVEIYKDKLFYLEATHPYVFDTADDLVKLFNDTEKLMTDNKFDIRYHLDELPKTKRNYYDNIVGNCNITNHQQTAKYAHKLKQKIKIKTN